MKQIQITDQNLLFDLSAALLHADLQSLWKQCASITILPGPGEKQIGVEEEEEEEARGESEQDREILRAERKRRHSSRREVGLCEGAFLKEWRSFMPGTNINILTKLQSQAVFKSERASVKLYL